MKATILFLKNGGEITDRWIKIQWFFNDNYEFFGRVDNSDWRKISPVGNHKTNFTSVSLGWISSYDGGSIYIKNLTIYDETCLPDWMKKIIE